MNIGRLAGWLLLPALGLAVGCIRPREYRPVGKLTPLQVPPQPDATALHSIAVQEKTALPVGTSCLSANGQPIRLTIAAAVTKGKYTDSGPCIAFVEYRKSGERYEQAQIDSAEALVRKAIQDDPDHQPVIVGFVHGWKHGASPGNGSPGQISTSPPEDSNIQGFEHVLNFLYRCYYANPETHNPCLARERGESLGRIHGHVVVGIYFAWYGADISPFWPVAQTLSVYSRGKEADKVATESDLSNDLQRLSDVAHPTPKPDNEPMFVLVGHSYGGRLLEQAIEKPLKARIEQQLRAHDPASVPTFADLVLYVNSAAPAAYGIGMLDFLAQHQVTYRKTIGTDQTGEPLLAAITTPADAATGFIFTASQAPFTLQYTGTETIQGFDPAQGKTFTVNEDQRKLHRDTLGHLKEFQTHSVVDTGPKAESACSGGTPGTFLYFLPDHCFQVAPATPMDGQEFRWNGTPYWVLSTDGNIIPDHGTIFTNRLLRFVGHMLPDERDKAVVAGK